MSAGPPVARACASVASSTHGCAEHTEQMPAARPRRFSVTIRLMMLSVMSSFRSYGGERLLLREAMQGAEAEHQVNGMYADDGTVPEQIAKDAQRDAVVRIVECRHDHRGVRDVEVGVT